MQLTVVDSVLKILEKAGFVVADLVETKPRCFEIIARRGALILLIKALYNIDSLKAEMAEEIKAVALLLKASPFVVGEKFKLDYLDRGVVYSRYGIPVINTATFFDLVVESNPPVVYSAPGGYYVKLDSDRIKEARERMGVSLGELSKSLGISRRAVKKYEEGVDTSVENAIKLEEVLQTKIVKAINVLDFLERGELREWEMEINLTEEESVIMGYLHDIGIKLYPIRHAPFDLISKSGELVLTGIKQVREIEKRAFILGKVSDTLSTKAAYITDKSTNKEFKAVIFLMKEELTSVSSPKDFIALLNEKQEKQEEK